MTFKKRRPPKGPGQPRDLLAIWRVTLFIIVPFSTFRKKFGEQVDPAHTFSHRNFCPAPNCPQSIQDSERTQKVRLIHQKMVDDGGIIISRSKNQLLGTVFGWRPSRKSSRKSQRSCLGGEATRPRVVGFAMNHLVLLQAILALSQL